MTSPCLVVFCICAPRTFACQHHTPLLMCAKGGQAMMQKSIRWMGAAFAAALAITAITLVAQGTDNKATRLALELTARFSFVLFWLAYAGGAMAALFRIDALAGRGREFGLAFAAAHLVHIGLVIWL